MLFTTLLLSALAATPADADPSLAFSRTYESRQARLLEGLQLESDYVLPSSPVLQLTHADTLALAPAPLALDTGGGLRSDERAVVALLLGLIVGFGTGHLIAGDRDGFLLFLIVDVAIIVAGALLHAAVGHGIFWGLGLLVSHIIQGITAYEAASGRRLVELTRSRAVQLAAVHGEVPAAGREPATVTTRVYGLSF